MPNRSSAVSCLWLEGDPSPPCEHPPTLGSPAQPPGSCCGGLSTRLSLVRRSRSTFPKVILQTYCWEGRNPQRDGGFAESLPTAPPARDPLYQAPGNVSKEHCAGTSRLQLRRRYWIQVAKRRKLWNLLCKVL